MRLAVTISLKTMFKDSILKHVMNMDSNDSRRLPTHQIRLGGPMIQNNSRIHDEEKQPLSLETKMEIILKYLRATIAVYDFRKLASDKVLWQNYPNLINSVFNGMQRSG